MKNKDFNPKESIQIFENVLFTQIVKDDIQNVRLIDLIPVYKIISHHFKLEIYFDDSGYMLANNRHFKMANIILKNSIMYN